MTEAMKDWIKECKELRKENEILAKHILELQADKGRLTDENRQAKEIIRELAKYEMQGAGCVYWKNKAEAFLKE